MNVKKWFVFHVIFKILLTVFNQSYNCQTSHCLGRNLLPKPLPSLPSLLKTNLQTGQKRGQALMKTDTRGSSDPSCPKLKIKSQNSKSFIALAVVPGSSRTKWGTFFGTQRNLLRLRSSSQKRHGDGMKASRKFGDLLP